jgi:hypothetical protein
MKKFRRIPDKLMSSVRNEIKRLLHAERDRLRTVGKNTLRTTFDIMGPYYSEAIGILKCLQIQGYGEFDAVNLCATDYACRLRDRASQPEQNFAWFKSQLTKEVLEEEGFGGDHRCEHCLKKYGVDDRVLINDGRLAH